MTPPLPTIEARRRWRPVLNTIGGLATGILIVGVLFILVQTFALTDAVRNTQVDRTRITEDTQAAAVQAKQAAEDAARSADRIEDCTTPGRECFEASQQRTAEAVVDINEGTLRVIVAALSCQQDGITGQRALARCTVKRAKATPDQP